MNYCKSCGIILEDEGAELCPKCAAEEKAVTNTPELPVPENVVAGIVGGALFSLIGVALYFVCYQMGFIAGICGLAIFFLTGIGYDIFAKTKGRKSTARLVTCILTTVVMLFAAEYLSLAYQIFDYFKEYGISFFDAVASVPEFLTDPDVGKAVLGDLVFAYVFAVVAIVSELVAKAKAEKAKL